MITDMAYDIIMSSAYNMQVFKHLMLINFIISVVQMSKFTEYAISQKNKKLRLDHSPSQLLIVALVYGLSLPSLCVIYVFFTSQVLNCNTMEEGNLPYLDAFYWSLLFWLV